MIKETINFVSTTHRPQCSVPGCTNPAAHIVGKTHPGYPRYRRSSWIKDMYPGAFDIFCCNLHHNENTARKHGVETAGHLTAKRNGLTFTEYNAKKAVENAKRQGFASVSEYTATKAKELAIRQGFDSVIEYKNSIHPYLRYRKDFCENVDGRLGFVCNTVLPTQEIIDAAGLVGWKPKQFLEVDHIDGNHTHNNPDNLQTLCKHCHVIKSFTNGDNLTPGRKTREKTTNVTNIYINDSTVNIKTQK